MNKKGQFEDRLFAIILIFIIAVILFFFNHLNSQIYDSYDDWFNNSADYNNSEARDALTEIKSLEEGNMWDYAFFAIFVGFIIQIILFSFATRFNIAFYWILVLLDIPLLLVGVVLSNIWQSLVATPEFAVTITRFPITNLILGTYYPIAIVTIIFISSIILFGKRPGAE